MFELGDQPNWANTEKAKDCDGISFVESVLSDEPDKCLRERGFAIIQIPHDVRKIYDNFLDSFEGFSKAPLEYRSKFALLQFGQEDSHSPNQLHGYSEVPCLKSQFMMRVEGHSPGQLLENPKELKSSGTRLFFELDEICRKAASSSDSQQPFSKLNRLLDPPCDDFPENYISSSILDCFHYFGEEKSLPGKSDRFCNNHASHTDSGLLTAVITTDVPGLEVLDQKLGEWVSVEKHIHEFCKETGNEHRNFATLFWGDSVVYLDKEGLDPCLHRVEKTETERFSVVFKQRTTPLDSPPRYQEDFVLAEIQQKALLRNPMFKKRSRTLMGFGIVACFLKVIF